MVHGLALGACAAAMLVAALGADVGSQTSGAGDAQAAKIPLDLALQLSTLENFTEFKNFIDSKSLEEDADSDIFNRFGDDEVDRKAVTVPKNAVCMPELQVVELIKDKDPTLLYFPACTRLEQCGGCCISELHTCQPVKTEMLNYKVYVSEYTISGKFKQREKQHVMVERHLACECKCTVKKEDCNRLQEYEEDNCSCTCVNTDEEKKCLAENTTKIWDPRNCVCSCRQTQECSTGYYYNHSSCTCTQIPTKSHHHHHYVTAADSRYRRGYVTQPAPLPVLPLHSKEDKQ